MNKLRLRHLKKAKKLRYCAPSKSLSPSLSDMCSSYKISNYSRSIVKVLRFFNEPYVMEKYGPKKIPYLKTFQVVYNVACTTEMLP